MTAQLNSNLNFFNRSLCASLCAATLLSANIMACGRRSDLKPLSVEQALEVRQFKSFSLEVQNYCPESGSRFSDVFFTNFSMVAKNDLLLPDWDRDGIADRDDNNSIFGFNYKNPSSTGTGYSDLAIWRRGITISDQSKLKACENPKQDTDHDGLSDCEEEVIYHTDPQKFDTDGDGIPDGLEVRFGTNPLDSRDAQLDPDGDGESNITEIRQNTPVNEANSESLKQAALKISTGSQVKDGVLNPGCMFLRADNVPLMNVSNGNLIKIHILEINSENKPALKVLSVVVPEKTPDKTLIKADYSGILEK